MEVAPSSAVGRVETVGQRFGAAPGEVGHAVAALALPFTAVFAGHAFRVELVEGEGLFGGQRLERGHDVLLVAAAGKRVDQPGQGVAQIADQIAGEGRVVGHALQHVGHAGAPVDAAHAAYRGHHLRVDRGHVAGGGAAVAVADQINLVGAGGGEDVLHLAGQLFCRAPGCPRRR